MRSQVQPCQAEVPGNSSRSGAPPASSPPVREAPERLGIRRQERQRALARVTSATPPQKERPRRWCFLAWGFFCANNAPWGCVRWLDYSARIVNDYGAPHAKVHLHQSNALFVRQTDHQSSDYFSDWIFISA